MPDSTRLLLGWRDDAPPPAVGFSTAAPRRPTGGPEPVWSDDEGHLVTFGPTGAGKGRAAILPALLEYCGPAVVVDPKGEACAVTARHRARLGPVVRLDPYRLTTDAPDALNPFHIVRSAGMNVTEASLLLADLLAPPTFSREPFWDNRATSLISGLIELVFRTAEPEEAHPGTLRQRMATDDLAYSLAVLLDRHPDLKDTFGYQEVAQFLQLPAENTRGSVHGTATQHTVLLGDPAVAAAVRETTFDLDAVRRGDPMTVYLVLPVDKLRSHGRLLRLWVATLLRVLMARTERPRTPTLFLLDEAGNLGQMDDLVTAVTLLRGYGVRTWSFWQSLQQVQRLYPDDWHTLLANAAAVQVLGSHWLDRTALAKLLDVPPAALAVSADRQLLVTGDGERAVLRKADYLADDRFAGLYDANPLFRGWDHPRPTGRG